MAAVVKRLEGSGVAAAASVAETARLFGGHARLGVGLFYLVAVASALIAALLAP